MTLFSKNEGDFVTFLWPSQKTSTYQNKYLTKLENCVLLRYELGKNYWSINKIQNTDSPCVQFLTPSVSTVTRLL